MSRLPLIGGVLFVLGGCGRPATSAAPRPQSGTAGPVPATSTAPRRGLPPVPVVREAPLRLVVRYPAERQLLTSRDSNFVLGSVGSGDVMLQINGQVVPVAPNGAFLAWLANPPAAAPRYELRASRGTDTVQRAIAVRFPARAALPAGGRLRVDSSSVLPARGWWARADELVRVAIRAPRNAQVVLLGRDSLTYALFAPSDGAAIRASSTTASAAAPLADTMDVATIFATEVVASQLGDSLRPARLRIARGRDTLVVPIPVQRTLAVDRRLLASLRSEGIVATDTDRVIHGRTIPDGTYKWMFLPGTVLEVRGRQQGFTKLRLDATLDVWVDNQDVQLLPTGTPLPRRVMGGMRVSPADDWVDLVLPMAERPAHLVESDARRLSLTLYGVQANPEISPIIGNDTLIRRISWEQVTSDRVRIELQLGQPTFGWLALWDDARRAFILRVRRAPHIDPTSPLRGLTIAVDPGHPPAGSTGPTGLFEGDAVLPVAEQLAQLLQARGARAVMTRQTRDPLGLTERTVASRRAGAHAFVSIHLNALPDGVNPFTSNGTSTLFFHQASEPLARVVQEELVARFGLRDLGVHYQNLAVARPSWYPSVLTEGLYVIMPEQEAAMRDPEFQRRYAEGILAGLERYFRTLAATPVAR